MTTHCPGTWSKLRNWYKVSWFDCGSIALTCEKIPMSTLDGATGPVGKAIWAAVFTFPRDTNWMTTASPTARSASVAG